MYEIAATLGPQPTTEFQVLGPLTVVVDGSPVRLGGPRQIAVLGRLVLSPGHVVSMDQLVDSVWDGDAPNRPEVAIRSYVSNLRRSIEPSRDRGDRHSCIESMPPGYRLHLDRSQIDAYRFEALLSAGQSALTAGDPASAVANFASAQALWRGEVCQGMVESDALYAYRSRLSELRLAMIEHSSAARLELGELEGVIADVESAIALHPLRERLTELAMLALYRAGRQSDALAACRDLRSRLIESLGVTPGRPIEELEHRILTHDPTLLPPAGSADNAAVQSSAVESSAVVNPAASSSPPTGESGVGGAEASGSLGAVAERASNGHHPGHGEPEPGTVGSGRSEVGRMRRIDGWTTEPADQWPADTARDDGGAERSVAPPTAGKHDPAASGAGSNVIGLDEAAATGLAGRGPELQILADVARDIDGGRGHTIVVTGESGIGKTALVEDFARRHAGTRVVWGRCRPIAAALPLWPWGQVLDGLAAFAEPDLVERIDAIAQASSAGREDDGLFGIDGSSEDGLDDHLDPVDQIRLGGDRGAPGEGASLFRPIVEVLRRVARREPLVVVIDDAQWADPSSIELLTFAGTSLADEAIAFFVVWREPNPGGPTAGLRALGRPKNVVRIPLSPLDRGAVEDLLERRGIGGGTLAARILSETAGNASFITELITDIGGAGDETSNLDPTGGVAVALRPTAALRDRVLDRLEEVDDEAEGILTVAAIHGPGFTGDVLAEIVELPSGRVDEALERLVGAGLVVGEPGAVGYRFTHPIVAKALISKLSGPRRARLHTAVGHARWRRGAPEIVLARHFSKAGSAGTSLLAARFALTAAREQVALDDLFELEEIVRSGLDAMSGLERSEALAAELGLFLCQIARIRGERSEHRRLAVEAIRAAEMSGEPRLAGAAVLAATGPPVDGPAFSAGAWVGAGIDDEPGGRRRLAELMREQGPSNPLSVALAIRVARSPLDIDDPWTVLETADVAALLNVRARDDTNPGGSGPAVDETDDVFAHVELARLVLVGGDAEPIGPLVARFGLDHQAIDRGRMATILDHRLDVERSSRQRGHERLLAARLRLVDGFDRSDPVAIDAVVDELTALPAPGTAPEALDLDRLALEVTALLPLGELGQVERRIGRARMRCQRVSMDPVAFDRQQLVLRWVQGKLDALDSFADGRNAQLDQVGELAIQALAALGKGDVDPARASIEELTELPRWRSLLADPSDAGTVGLVAIAASQVGDEQTSAAAFEKLRHWTDRTVALWGGLVLLGPGCLLAGIAAAGAGDRTVAHAMLSDSEDRCRAVGARAWLRQTRVAQAALAAASGDRERAERLWAESVDLATEMVAGRRLPDPKR